MKIFYSFLTTTLIVFFNTLSVVSQSSASFISGYQTGSDAQEFLIASAVRVRPSFPTLEDHHITMNSPEFSAATAVDPPFVQGGSSFYNRYAGDPTSDFTLDLNTIFNDDGGVDNLTYEIVSVAANTFINTSTITGDILTMSFLPNELGSAKVIVKATDSELLTAQYEFLIQVIPVPVPFLRINAGGPKFGSWSADKYFITTTGQAFVNNVPIANTTNDFIYQSERWQSTSFSYSIPVPATGYYTVNLHFAEIFRGLPDNGGEVGGVGTRNFHVKAEGDQRLTSYDIFAKAGGAAIAIVEELDSVYVSDGFLTLEFIKIQSKDNPKISAIEVARYQVVPIANTPPDVDAPGDRYIFTGGDLSLQLVASDLNNDVLSYQAVGLPASMTINAATGVISGIAGADEIDIPVAATVNDGKGGSTVVNFTIHVVKPESYIQRINAGGPQQTFGDEVWQGDQYYLGGNSFSVINDITNTTKDQVYQSERIATRLMYEIPMPGPGRYNVTLHFAEVFWSGPGQRVFDVNIEGNGKVLDDYDIVQVAGGAFLGTSETFSVNVTDGSLSLLLRASVDEAQLAGIEIEACVSPLITSFTASVTSICPGASTTLTVSGNLGDATIWKLYSGSCGGTLIEANTTGEFTVSPSASTTYYVRGEGGCTEPGTCTSINVNVKEVNTTIVQTGNRLNAASTGTSYQWINCSGPTDIVGETTKTFDPPSTGSYAVRITQNGCTDESGCYEFIFVGLAEELKDRVTMYPNPSSGTVSIDMPVSARNININIVDLSGKDFLKYSFDRGGVLKLDTHSLTPGIYLILIKSTDGSEVKKLVLK